MLTPLLGCAAPVSVKANGCGPGWTMSVDDAPIEECILGYWEQSLGPCGAGVCGDGGPAQCDAGCRRYVYMGFYVDGGYVTGEYVASPTLPVCSSLGTPTWNSYTVSGDKAKIGIAPARSVICSDSKMSLVYSNNPPVSEVWQRVRAEEVCEAVKDGGTWSSVGCAGHI